MKTAGLLHVLQICRCAKRSCSFHITPYPFLNTLYTHYFANPHLHSFYLGRARTEKSSWSCCKCIKSGLRLASVLIAIDWEPNYNNHLSTCSKLYCNLSNSMLQGPAGPQGPPGQMGPAGQKVGDQPDDSALFRPTRPLGCSHSCLTLCDLGRA